MAENYNLIRAPLEMYTAADVKPKEVKWLNIPRLGYRQSATGYREYLKAYR